MPSASPVSSFLDMLDTFAPMKDAIDGYRADWIRRGYSETAAEMMAVDLHRAMLGSMSRT